MDYLKNYEKWIASDVVSDTDKQELFDVKNDTKELEDRFYRDLEFGTAGMRGVLGIGTNRLNIYNVRHATAGVAEYVNKEGETAKKKGVLIGYDTRIMSREFAEETASGFSCCFCIVCKNISLSSAPTYSTIPLLSASESSIYSTENISVSAIASITV